MMSYGPFPFNNATPVAVDVGSGIAYVRIINESGYQAQVNMGGMGTDTVPIWHLQDINCINQITGYQMLTGQIQISGINFSNISSAQFPTSQVSVVTYMPGELAQPLSVALSRLANIGNTVQTSMATTATTLQNDGNPAGTQFLEVTESGSPGSNWFFDNKGNAFVAQWDGSTYIKFFQLIAGVGPSLSTLRFGDASGTTFSEFLTTAQFNGNIDLFGSLILSTGSITRISYFNGSAGTAGTTVTHGLGAIPSYIGFTETHTGGDSVTSFSYDPATLTSTQVKVFSNNATARTFVAFAIV